MCITADPVFKVIKGDAAFPTFGLLQRILQRFHGCSVVLGVVERKVADLQ
jgi:hypothetical protein